jgi:hypothetical protein
MLTDLKAAAVQAGFNLIIAESDKNIDNQLNRIVRTEQLPLALSSWDLNVNVTFDENGFLQNPTTQVTMLLVDKALTLEKIDLEEKAEETGVLFIKFIRILKTYMLANTNVKEDPITDISFVYVPSYGPSKHSGVLGKFTMQLGLDSECI